MTTVNNKEILLAVADEIENDPNYTGEHWVHVKNPCGCAMTRLVAKLGAEIHTDSDNVYERENISNGFTFEGRFRINWASEDVLHEKTGIPWGQFRNFSVEASAAETAAKLRHMAETGEFD